MCVNYRFEKTSPFVLVVYYAPSLLDRNNNMSCYGWIAVLSIISNCVNYHGLSRQHPVNENQILPLSSLRSTCIGALLVQPVVVTLLFFDCVNFVNLSAYEFGVYVVIFLSVRPLPCIYKPSQYGIIMFPLFHVHCFPFANRPASYPKITIPLYSGTLLARSASARSPLPTTAVSTNDKVSQQVLLLTGHRSTRYHCRLRRYGQRHVCQREAVAAGD